MIVAATVLALGSGIVNLTSVMGGPGLASRAAKVAKVFPLEFVHVSRFAAVLAGLGLVVLSINIWRRKKRAYLLALALAITSVGVHLTKGLDYEEAIVSAALAVVLWSSRKLFTVRSSTPDLGRGFRRLAAALGSAIGYGIAGFWLLEKREFGLDFTLADAVAKTLRFFTFRGDPSLVPRTLYAEWFLDSLYVMSAVAIAYSVFAVFRPVVYRYRTLPHERELAREIVNSHGNSSLDYFKFWRDKGLFFSPSRKSFLAYRVGSGCAVVLGDPVGEPGEIEPLVRDFQAMCQENDWDVVFYQVPGESLPLYESLGFRKLKVGEDAIVDLTTFSLQGKTHSKLRSKVNQFTREGIRFERHEPPLSALLLAQAKEVSDSWLSLPGRRERTFSLGLFDPEYVRGTPLYAAVDKNDRMVGFVNIVPSYVPGEATIDLMRHREDSPPGTMDFLFAQTMLALKEQGFARFTLGMAPMSGFQPQETPGPEEKAIHYLMQRLGFIFSYRGLRDYKGKFATSWEPRYLVYRDLARLPLIGRSLVQVMELNEKESH
ncbi:MAG: phosphatidylglycerol lysyltransferase domain-containing protein [Bryobacterales bacterium]